MSDPLLRASWRYWRRHPWQLALSIVGVSLGVAVALAIELANGSARRAFELSTRALVGQATDEITAGPSGLTDAFAARLRLALEGQGVQLAPVVVGHAEAGDGERSEVLRVLGVDPLADRDFRPYLQGGTLRDTRLAELMTRPGAVLLGQTTAGRLGWKPGESAAIRVAGVSHALHPVALLAPEGALARQALDGIAVCDLATAQELLGRLGRVDRVDLILPPGPAGDALRERLRTMLPAGARLEPAGQRAGAMRQMIGAFQLNLRALSLLALLVGVFLIYNATSFSVVQRRAQIARFRALGATRRQVLRALLCETLAMAALGLTLGALAGVALAQQLLVLVTRTINDLYFVLSVRELAIAPGAVLQVGGLALVATLLGALIPAWEATRAHPRVALSRSGLEQSYTAGLGRATAAGLLAIAVGLGILLLPGERVDVGFAALFTILVGGALLTPIWTRGLLWLAAPLLAPLGVVGRLARGGLARSPSRSWVATAALALAVSVGVGVGTMVGSFRQAVTDWLDSALAHDIFVSPPSPVGNRSLGVVDAALVAEMRAIRGVAAAATIRRVDVRTVDGEPTQLVANDPGASLPPLHLLSGAPARAWPAWRDGGGVLVSESLAYRRQLTVGGALRLVTDRGPRDLPVVGVYRDYASDLGVAMIHRATYERLWDDRGVSAVGLDLADGADLDAVLARLRALAAGRQALDIRGRRSLLDASLAVFDRTFVVTDVLALLATVVAFVGVLSSLLALELERARERATMRALGMTPRQLGAVVACRTALLGLSAGTLSIPLGLAMSRILVDVINRRSFGWSLELVVTPGPLLTAVGLSLAAALLASVYPVLRQSRAALSPAMRHE